MLDQDAFGNLTLDASPAQLKALGAMLGDRLTVHFARREHAATHALAFADVSEGELLLYEESRGHLALVEAPAAWRIVSAPSFLRSRITLCRSAGLTSLKVNGSTFRTGAAFGPLCSHAATCWKCSSSRFASPSSVWLS